MSYRCLAVFSLSFSMIAGLGTVAVAAAQDSSNPPKEYRGRKYKAPPEVSHIEVVVIKGYNKKPIPNAAVVFHSIKDGRDEGNLEVKTDPDGKAVIDVIPTGSTLTVQVIADGFATFAEDYLVDGPSKSIAISMIRPRAQISTYEDNSGKPADRAVGVQEPAKPMTLPGTPVVPPASTTAPAAKPPATPAKPADSTTNPPPAASK